MNKALMGGNFDGQEEGIFMEGYSKEAVFPKSYDGWGTSNLVCSGTV